MGGGGQSTGHGTRRHIDMIKTRHSDHDEEACREMLATWLEGNNGEVSWTALTQALIDAGQYHN